MNRFTKTRYLMALGLLVILVGACDEDSPSSKVYAEGGVWEDPATLLIWQREPPEDFVSWMAALEYCETVELDGHDDWRLPTISELRTLIVGCEGTAPGGACNVTDECPGKDCSSDHCYSCEYDYTPEEGCFSVLELSKPCDHYWSSTRVTEYADRAWAVGFSSGFVYKPRTVYSFHARCVR